MSRRISLDWAELFGDIRPACTFVEVSRFIDESWLVEVEADAFVAGP